MRSIPVALVKQGRTQKRRIIYNDFRCLVDTASAFGCAVVGIEQVNGVPGQSGPASFQFGKGVGLVIAALMERTGREPIEVPPNVWKRHHGLPLASRIGRTEVKKASRLKAIELWPHAAHLFSRAMDEGLAEACLIAEFLRVKG